jgi:DNA-binding transcriptional regulator LsrR (DeoR family)
MATADKITLSVIKAESGAGWDTAPATNAMVGMMSTKYPDATAYNLPTIPVKTKEEYEKQMAANPKLQQIYREIWDVDIMVLGVGYLTGPMPGFRAFADQEMGLTAEDLTAKGVVAEINHTPIDAPGEPMLDGKDKELAALTRRVIGVGPWNSGSAPPGPSATWWRWPAVWKRPRPSGPASRASISTSWSPTLTWPRR